jgi:hypothetical protein
MTAPLTVRTTPGPYGGYRYCILDGTTPLITSGIFNDEADAFDCGQRVAVERVLLEDFLRRKNA